MNIEKMSDKSKYSVLGLIGASLGVIVIVMTVYAWIGGDFDRIEPKIDYSSFYYNYDELTTAPVAVSPADSDVPASAQPASSIDSVNNTVCINTATAEELASTLPGIGPSKAQAIVDYRTAIGRFNSIDELIEVKGIGQKTLENIRAYCTLD